MGSFKFLSENSNGWKSLYLKLKSIRGVNDEELQNLLLEVCKMHKNPHIPRETWIKFAKIITNETERRRKGRYGV